MSDFEHYINKVCNISYTFQTISHSKVFKSFNKLVTSKATGLDKIPGKPIQ